LCDSNFGSGAFDDAIAAARVFTELDGDHWARAAKNRFDC
jgi:hypothetical protein